jgi:hypothetical protein
MARKEDANEAGKAAMADLRELMKSYREVHPGRYRSTRRPK